MKNLRQQLNRILRLASMASVVFALLFFAVLTVQSAFTPEINYQGKLTDASGNVVVNGSYNFIFRLCQDSACASPLWTETYEGANKVAVSSGLFSTMLGSITSLASVDFNQSLYLEVQVGGSNTPSYETLLPRKILGTVPNSFNAQKFDGLATTSFLRADISNTVANFFNLNATTSLLDYVSSTAITVSGNSYLSGLSVTGASSLATLSVAGNATTSGYLTVGSAPTGANFTAGNLNVQNNGVFGGYVSSTSGFYTQSNLSVGGTSVFTGLISGSGFTSAFDSRMTGTWRGLANGVASLGADGKVPDAQLSPLAITDTFVVGTEAAMLALAAGMGDVAIRYDISKSYILDGDGDPTVLGNWKELLSPTDAVSAVNGQRGAVTLSTDDITEGIVNFYFTNARFDDRINTAWRALPNGLASLDSAGHIPTSQIGSILINNTFVVGSTSTMLTLSTAVQGDIAVVTSTNKTYVLQDSHPELLSDWVELLNGASVTSVNGLLGAVTLTTSEITEGTNQYWTQGKFDTALAGATTWTGDLFVSAGNVGIGIANTSNALEVIGNASTSNNVYVGNNLYVGYSNGVNSDAIYFNSGLQSLVWNTTNNRFELSDGLYITNNATTSGYMVIGNGLPAGYGTATGDLNVQNNLAVGGIGLFGSYVSSTGLQVNGNASTTGSMNIAGSLGLNSEYFTDLTGLGLTNYGGTLRVSTTSLALLTTDVAEGSNLYWTSDRATSSFNLLLPGYAGFVSSTYSTQAYNTSTFLSLTNWFATTSAPQLTTLAGLTSIGSAGVNTAINGTLSAGTSTLTNLIVSNLSTSTFAGGLTVGTSQFIIQQATGNVIIGTTEPTNAIGDILEVYKNQATSTRIAVNNPNASGYANLRFYQGTVVTGGNWFDNANNLYVIGAQKDSNSALTLNTGGLSPTERMRITGDGKVGIGTTVPGKDLEINSATGANLRLTYNDADGSATNYADLSVGTDGALTISPANSATTTIANGLVVNTNSLVVQDATGNVGIGTASPRLRLNVVGVQGAPATTGTTQTGVVRVENPTNGNVLDIGNYGSTDGFGSWFQATNLANLGLTYSLALNPNGGNVGIGTSTPDSLLQVGNATQFFKVSSLGNATTSGYLSVGTTLSAGTSTLTNLIVSNLSTSTFAGGLTVGTSQFVVQQSTGNVGIGNTNPARALSIYGTQASGVGLMVQNEITGVTNADGLRVGLDTSSNALIWQYENKDLSFGTNNTDRLHILAGGNVGIGTTTPDSLLQVGNATQFFKVSSLGNATTSGYLSVGSTLSAGTSTLTNLIVSNLSTSTFNGDILMTSPYSGTGSTPESRSFMMDTINSTPVHVAKTGMRSIFARIADTDFSSRLAFFTATDNTSVERMRIDQNGKVGIGTTVPGKDLEINSATGANLRLTYNDADGSATNYADLSVGTDGALTISPANSATTTIANGLVVNTNSLVVQDATGNVGIGTASPTATLQVGNPFASQIIGNTPIASIIGSGSTTTPETILRLQRKGVTSQYFPAVVDFNILSFDVPGEPNYGPGTQLNIALKAAGGWTETADVNVMTLRDNGNVGIGTTTPASKLDIYSAGSGLSDLLALTNKYASASGGLGSRMLFNGGYGNLAGVLSNSEGSGAAENEGYLAFQTAVNSTLAEKMRITSAGYVGIGTSTPDALLQVGNATQFFKVSSLGNATTSGNLSVRNIPYTWPSLQGEANTYLKNDGTGGLAWSTVTASPAGSNGQIQFNNAGAFGASANFFWDNTNKILGIATSTSSGYLGVKYINGGDPAIYSSVITATSTYISSGGSGSLSVGEAGGTVYLSNGGNGSLDVGGSGGTVYLGVGGVGGMASASGGGGTVNIVGGGNGLIYGGYGGGGGTASIASGGAGYDGYAGGAGGTINLAFGGASDDGVYSNDGTVNIGNANSSGQKNALLNVYGNASTSGNLWVNGGINSGADYTSSAGVNLYLSGGGSGNYISDAGGGGTVDIAHGGTGNGSGYDGGTGGTVNLALGGTKGSGSGVYGNDGTVNIGNSAGQKNALLNVSGKVGIGTTTPRFSLEVNQPVANSAPGINIINGEQKRAMIGFGYNPSSTTGWVMGQDLSVNGTQDFFLYDNANSAVRLYISATGAMGIGTITPAYTLDVVGTSTNVARFRNNTLGTTCTLTSATGIITCTSDSRLKKNVSTITSALQVISELRPITYQWLKGNDNLPLQYGFIAQEVETVLPNLVSTDDEGYKALSMVEIIPFLTGAIQEQQQEIDLLKSHLSASTPVLQSFQSSSTLAVINAEADYRTLAVRDAAVFYGTITVIGEAGFESKVTFNKEVEFKDHITVDSDTAGTAMIAAGATSTEILFNKPYGLMPRVVANMQASGTPMFASYLIAEKSIFGFKIILENPAPSDLYFDWIALAAKDREGQVAGAEETLIPGCTDASANNYNALATQNDGSCVFNQELTPIPTERATPASPIILPVIPTSSTEPVAPSEPVAPVITEPVIVAPIEPTLTEPVTPPTEPAPPTSIEPAVEAAESAPAIL